MAGEGCGWTGWTGITLQGSLQWNSMDLLRTRLISKCRCSRTIISRRRAYAPNRLVLTNPDSWEHDMDNLIMEVTICQDEHRVDRSASPKVRLSGFSHRTDGRRYIKGRCKRLFCSALIAIVSYYYLPRTTPRLPQGAGTTS